LSRLEFLIGAKASTHPAYAPARPKAPDGTSMTPEWDRARIVTLFGEPDPGGSDETCLQIFHGLVISDFDLDGDGHLGGWQLYPDD
jgi:hypothetical protein